MNKLYTLACITGMTFLLFSFSTNPPDGFTGAPGDSLCSECHTLNNSPNLGTISIEGFPNSITPEQTYPLTVINRNTNDGAVRGGFQMTILGPNNTRAGDLTMPSANAVVSISGGRQYFEHNPAQEYPDSNVLRWTVLWKAPVIANGSQIRWFASGNIANGNFQSTGDRIVAAIGSGSVVVSATNDIVSNKPRVYPNPGSDFIHIELPGQGQPDGQILFHDTSGNTVHEADMDRGVVITTRLSPGTYFLEINDRERSYVTRWIKM